MVPQAQGPELCPLLFQNPSKASQSSRDTLSSGVHSWSSQAEARSSSWNMVLARGRPTDTPSYFNGTPQHLPAQLPPQHLIGLRRGSPRQFMSPFSWSSGGRERKAPGARTGGAWPRSRSRAKALIVPEPSLVGQSMKDLAPHGLPMDSRRPLLWGTERSLLA